jgi:hypothetical protein
MMMHSLAFNHYLFTSMAYIRPFSHSPPPTSEPYSYQYHHTTASKPMCTTYQICYLPCKREDYGRGPEDNMSCIDEDFRQCKHAIESSEGCLEPVVRSIWIKYKYPEHGGPEPQKREELMRERWLQGRDRQIVVKKGKRPSAWNSAVCSIM